MGKLTSIPFEQETGEIKDKVKNYWTKRTESFSEQKHEEIHSYKADLWKEGICSLLPEGKDLSILDVGCGSGYFEAILSPLGYKMTGTDLTPEMIDAGKDLVKRHGGEATMLVMDAEDLLFPDESFDVVVTRNLTWTLPHPDKAYAEWFRVLKPGGVLINFDAEYAKGFHNLNQDENNAHAVITDEMKEECHEIYHMLSISALNRPDWDAEVLSGIGFSDISIDPTAGDRLYGEKDQFYFPDRMFRIRAVKP